MGIWDCKKHEPSFIGFACKHVIRDMEKKLYTYPCHIVKFKIKDKVTEGVADLSVTVCDYCFRSKNLDYEMEIQNYDIILDEMSKYIGVSQECHSCIKEFVEICNNKYKK